MQQSFSQRWWNDTAAKKIERWIEPRSKGQGRINSLIYENSWSERLPAFVVFHMKCYAADIMLVKLAQRSDASTLSTVRPIGQRE